MMAPLRSTASDFNAGSLQRLQEQKSKRYPRDKLICALLIQYFRYADASYWIFSICLNYAAKLCRIWFIHPCFRHNPMSVLDMKIKQEMSVIKFENIPINICINWELSTRPFHWCNHDDRFIFKKNNQITLFKYCIPQNTDYFNAIQSSENSHKTVLYCKTNQLI